MVQFTAVLKKMGQQGEKTGWTYLDLDVDKAQALLPGNKRSFRVKGYLDGHAISGVATIPIGEGAFIIAVNAGMRKAIKKGQGETVTVKLELDKQEVTPSAELMDCLQDEPLALQHFNSLAKSHQNYFTNWIESAKTDTTKAKRIAQAINGLSKGAQFGEVIRKLKGKKRRSDYENGAFTNKGQVQGVFYRASAKRKADELGLSGWVKNEAPGDVEAVATGANEALELFIEWCKNGHSGATVKEVTVTDIEITESLTDFQIRK